MGKAGCFLVVLVSTVLALPAWANGPRTQKEVQTDLMQLEAMGLQAKQLKGLGLIDADELFSNTRIFYPLLDAVRILSTNGRSGSGFFSKEDNEIAGRPENQTRLFRLWLDLLRLGLRSESKRIRGLTVSNLSPQTIFDFDLADDLIKMTMEAGDEESHYQDSLRMALHCLESCVSYRMDDFGVVTEDLAGVNGKIMGEYVRMKLLAPFRADYPKEGRSVKIKRAGEVLGESFGPIPLEGWKVLSDFVRNEWGTASLAEKKALVGAIEGLSLRDPDAADLMIALDKFKRNVPLKIALIKAMKQHGFKYEKSATWIRAMLQDENASVRENALWAIGHNGGPRELTLLESTFHKGTDEASRVSAAYALAFDWERNGDSDQREIAFAKAAVVFAGAKGDFKSRLGRALSFWNGVPATTKATYGFTGKVLEACEKTLFDPAAADAARAAQENDIWAGQ